MATSFSHTDRSRECAPVGDSQNVLDMMTAGIMERKAAKAAGLTPVPGKAPVPQPVEQPQGWNKADVDRILASIDATERSIGGLLSILRSEVRRGMPVAQDPDMVLDEGAYFAEHFAEQQKAAQEATFGKAMQSEAADPYPDDPDLWACPVHGADNIKSLTSRKGREYRACGSCEEFER